MSELVVKDLQVEVEGKPILHGVSLQIRSGEIHAIMGPNGSGKSTLAYTIAGHPKYQVTRGSIELDGEDITQLAPDARAKLGLFLAQQLPTEVDGVTLSNFLRAARTAVKGEAPKVREWVKLLENEMNQLNIDPSFASRFVNVGFSGGEKKRTEILQLRILQPKFAILDETDSGLDVDALKIVATGVNQAQADFRFGALLITHHTHLLDYVKPNYVHVFVRGRIVESGTSALAEQLVEVGFKNYTSD